MISQGMTDRAILEELGKRLRSERLNRNLSQQELVDRAGIGRTTLSRMERGGDYTLSTLVKILRVLGRLDSLDQFLSEPQISPIDALHRQSTARKRSRRSRDPTPSSWAWGDNR